MPVASILVPMRNAERYVRETLDSLLQDDIDLQIVVIDDHSSDRSAALVRACADSRVSLIPGPGRGISAALNAGLAQARAPLVMRCDADDLYSIGRIARQIHWLQDNPHFGAVCGGFCAIDSRGRFVAELPTGMQVEELTAELRAGQTRTHLGAFAMRTELLRSIGGFRNFFITAEDIDVQLRLARAARVMYVPGECYRYRLHDLSVTHTQARAQRLQYAEVAYRLQLQRRADGRDDLDLGLEAALQLSLQALAPTAPDPATPHLLGCIEGAAWTAHAQGQKFTALRTAARALRYRRWHPAPWRTLLALLLKPVGVAAAARRRVPAPGSEA